MGVRRAKAQHGSCFLALLLASVGCAVAGSNPKGILRAAPTAAASGAPPVTSAAASAAPAASSAPAVATAASASSAPAVAAAASASSAPPAKPALTSAKPAPAQAVPEPKCPCTEPLETYRKRSRSSVKRGDWAGAWLALRAAWLGYPHTAELSTELGYIALRAGYLEQVTPLNQDAYGDAEATDGELRASVLFTQGLLEERRGNSLRAALLFQWSLEWRDHLATRLHLLPLPNPEQRCANPSSIVDFCDCNAASVARSEDPAVLPVTHACSKVADAVNQRYLVVEQTISRSLGSRTLLMLLEARPTGLALVRKLGDAYTPGAMGVSASATLDSINLQTIRAHQVLVVRTTTGEFDHNNAGAERMGSTSTVDVLCPVAATPLECSEPVQVRATTSYSLYKNVAPEGEPDDYRLSEDRSSFVDYGYTVAADGTLTPKKLKGDLKLEKPPLPIKIW
ncbi:MAG: hypothetical protein QM756_37065 [Polyangiaceae bacterium]